MLVALTCDGRDTEVVEEVLHADVQGLVITADAGPGCDTDGSGCIAKLVEELAQRIVGERGHNNGLARTARLLMDSGKLVVVSAARAAGLDPGLGRGEALRRAS